MRLRRGSCVHTDFCTATNQTRIVKKTVPTESFFNFFSPPQAPGDDGAEDEDAVADIEERLELDYQLGEDIKEKLIPRAIDWFTGEALAFEEDFDDDEPDVDDLNDFGDEDEDDMSEDHDDEDESDEEVSSTTYSRLSLLACLCHSIRTTNLANQNKKQQNASKAEGRESGLATLVISSFDLPWCLQFLRMSGTILSNARSNL